MKVEVRAGRRLGLDFVRYVQACLVIWFHMVFPAESYVEAAFRVIVPMFCMITGFYYDATARKGKTTAQIKKIAKLLVFAIGLHILWEYLTATAAGLSTAAFVKYCLNPVSWLKFFLFNATEHGGHLWYLGAVLYSLILLHIADRFHIRERLYWLIPVLILANLVLGNYSVLLLGRRMPVLLTRNFLFFTLPFLLMGDWIRKTALQIKNPILLAAAGISFVTSLLEKRFLMRNFSEFNIEFYLSTTVLAVSLFLLVLQNDHWFHKGPLPFFSMLGRRTATSVYVIHYIMIGVMDGVIQAAAGIWPWIADVYSWVGPLVVLIASTVVVWLFSAAGEVIRTAAKKK